MPVTRSIQTSLASGEFDPLLWSREDVTFFYNSARIIENAVPLPQGGAKRREGWRYRSRQRGSLVDISLAGASATAPNGGTAANGIDGSSATALTTVNAIGTTSPYVILRVDLGSSQAVSFWEIIGARFTTLPAGVTGVAVAVQSSPDDATWTTRHTMNFGTTAYNRRFARPPGELLGTARYWRFVALPTVDLGAAVFTLLHVVPGGENAWPAAAAPGKFSLHRLTASITDEYILYITARCCDMFRADTGAWVASVLLPHTENQVEDIKVSPNLDTLVLYHEDVAPTIIQRLGADGDWRAATIVFDSVATFPFTDGSVSGGLDEIQIVQTDGMTDGDRVVVEFNGTSSDEMIWSNVDATNIASLTAAINGLPDFSQVQVALFDGTGGPVNSDYSITFTGADGKKPIPTLVFVTLTGSGTMTIRRKRFGKPDTAPLWSADRGYPRCGAFYQGRHWMGGFKSRPDVIVGSRAGALFDFREDADPVAGSPILISPNVDDQITVENIYPGRHLQIFTSSAEMYLPSEPITVDNVALKITTRHGSNRRTQPVDIQGGTLFVDRNGRALREYLFVDTEQSYSAEPISILAGHLMAAPRSLVLRRARDVDEPTLLLIANTASDRTGTPVPAAMCVIDRAQQVTGFFRVKTLGTPLSFMTSQGGDAFAVTHRELDGPAWNYLEQFDDEYLSDCGVKVENPDFDEITATAGQTVFPYTFASPTSQNDVAVFRRVSGQWVRFAGGEFEVDLGAQTVTLDPQDVGTEIRIHLRQSVADVGTAAPHLEGQEVFAHVDGLPARSRTVSAGLVDLGEERFDFECEVGLLMKPRIVLHPFKGRGNVSPTMQPMRIFRTLLALERTGDVSVGMAGEARPVSLQNHDSGLMDPTLEEVLFTGTRRVSGIGRWQIEPTLEISQSEPMPFILRSISYDVRY